MLPPRLRLWLHWIRFSDGAFDDAGFWASRVSPDRVVEARSGHYLTSILLAFYGPRLGESDTKKVCSCNQGLRQ